MRFQQFDEFRDFLARVSYGHISDVTVEFDDADAGYKSASRSPHKPLREFAETVKRHGGVMNFLVLKIQDGLPVFGETEYAPSVVQSHKFT